MIQAVMIDSREPDWVQRLMFGGAPTTITLLDYGDVHALTDDGCLLVIERKTPDDLLNSLREERLFLQMAAISHARIDEQVNGKLTTWPYLVITGEISRGPGGKAITERQTGWNWDAVQGALLSIQEMGVFVVFCGGDQDFEACIIRLAYRKREIEMKLLPPRIPSVLGPSAAILAALPGIGVERAMEILAWAGGRAGVAISGITDLDIGCPLGNATRRKVRAALGLKDGESLELFAKDNGELFLAIQGDENV